MADFKVSMHRKLVWVGYLFQTFQKIGKWRIAFFLNQCHIRSEAWLERGGGSIIYINCMQFVSVNTFSEMFHEKWIHSNRVSKNMEQQYGKLLWQYPSCRDLSDRKNREPLASIHSMCQIISLKIDLGTGFKTCSGTGRSRHTLC